MDVGYHLLSPRPTSLSLGARNASLPAQPSGKIGVKFEMLTRCYDMCILYFLFWCTFIFIFRNSCYLFLHPAALGCRPGEPSKEVRAAAADPPHITSNIFWQKMTQKTTGRLELFIVFLLKNLFTIFVCVYCTAPTAALHPMCRGGSVARPGGDLGRGCWTKL